MATTKQLTSYTVAQLQKMAAPDLQRIYDKLEDFNHHTACSIIECVKNKTGNIKALEALDDMHTAIGHMPLELSTLRRQLTVGGAA